MSKRLQEAALNREVIESIYIEREVEEVLDQHVREKEELMEANNELKGNLKERDEKLEEQDLELEEQKRIIEALKQQLKNKK